MKHEIIVFIKKACEKFGLKANYIPDGDIYIIHKDGFAVQNFTTDHFFQIPKRARMEMYGPLVRIGINGNLQANHKNQMVIPWKMGKKIV